MQQTHQSTAFQRSFNNIVPKIVYPFFNVPKI